MTLKLFLTSLIIGMSIAACNKEHNTQEGSLLKRIITSENIPLDTFLYDSKNYVKAFKYSNNNTQHNKLIEYDQEKFTKATYSYQNIDMYTCSFIYNTFGQITKKMASPLQGYQFAYDQSYAYNKIGQLVADTTFYQQTDLIQSYITYEYSNDQNLIESDFHNIANPSQQGKTYYKFDDKVNPRNSQGSMYYYITGDINYLSRNNIITIQPWWRGTITNQYEYQLNGLPKKMRVSDPNTTVSIRTLTLFEYW